MTAPTLVLAIEPFAKSLAVQKALSRFRKNCDVPSAEPERADGFVPLPKHAVERIIPVAASSLHQPGAVDMVRGTGLCRVAPRCLERARTTIPAFHADTATKAAG